MTEKQILVGLLALGFGALLMMYASLIIILPFIVLVLYCGKGL
jgi:hypothetical protein